MSKERGIIQEGITLGQVVKKVAKLQSFVQNEMPVLFSGRVLSKYLTGRRARAK